MIEKAGCMRGGLCALSQAMSLAAKQNFGKCRESHAAALQCYRKIPVACNEVLSCGLPAVSEVHGRKEKRLWKKYIIVPKTGAGEISAD